MLIVGAHESISGGIYKSIERGLQDDCECIQIFVKNSNRWLGKPISEMDIEKYNEILSNVNMPVCCHSSYLINMASSKPDIREKSCKSMVDELERCEKLGIKYYIIHPGAHLGIGEKKGLDLIVEMIDTIYFENNFNTHILLEITAGQGTNLGYKVEHLLYILEKSKYENKLGICLDSCHMYSAGFDILNRYDEVFDNLFQTFPNKIKVFHLNDSKKPLGSRVDRHDLIGKGVLGIDFFKKVVNDERFKDILGILETPIESDETYKEEVALLKSLRTRK
jgi:deoxyribonuclease-4